MRRCRNRLCNRLTTAAFCCPACALADERRYEIHESGPLAHSVQCDGRHAERGPAPPAWPRPNEAGFATVEAIAGIVFMVLLAAGVMVTVAWPSRINAAKAAAYEAARAATEAPDEASGEDAGRAIAGETWANHGYGGEALDLMFSVGGRGEKVSATVRIDLPVITVPLLGSWGARSWSTTSVARVPDYRGFR